LPWKSHGKEGSTVRVRQRALQKRRKTALFIGAHLHVLQHAMGMERFMELSGSERVLQSVGIDAFAGRLSDGAEPTAGRVAFVSVRVAAAVVSVLVAGAVSVAALRRRNSSPRAVDGARPSASRATAPSVPPPPGARAALPPRREGRESRHRRTPTCSRRSPSGRRPLPTPQLRRRVGAP
jgi:hypothetical protein